MTGSRDHGHAGVAKPAFSVGDLLDERFDFDRIALAILRHKGGEIEARSDAGGSPVLRATGRQ
jgi:hypothetical protein